MANPFPRWQPVESSTWVAQVFKRYDADLVRNINAHIMTRGFVYKALGENGANWSDDTTTHFDLTKTDTRKKLNNLKDWSKNYNDFDKWTILNVIMSMSANFETFLSNIVLLALKSDPGLLLGATKSIDGISIIKYGTYDKLNYDDYVIAVTKGDWSSRINSFEKIFGSVPEILTQKISELEAIRKLRNQIGHAIGRDIEESRKHNVKKLASINSLTLERMQRYWRIIWSCAKEVDYYLLNNHIGTFQFLLFYHDLYQKISHQGHSNTRAHVLNKRIGHSGVAPIPNSFYRDLVVYYESI